MSKGCNLWSSARKSPWPYSFEKSNFKQKSTWLSIKHILSSGWGFALAGFFSSSKECSRQNSDKNLIAKKDPSAKCLSSSVWTCPWMMSYIHLCHSLATLTQLGSWLQHPLEPTEDFQPGSAPADDQFDTAGAKWAWAHLSRLPACALFSFPNLSVCHWCNNSGGSAELSLEPAL